MKSQNNNLLKFIGNTIGEYNANNDQIDNMDNLVRVSILNTQ